MVPQNGIEPLIADYKAAVMPFNYKGVNWWGWFYLGQILEPLLVFAFAVCFHEKQLKLQTHQKPR